MRPDKIPVPTEVEQDASPMVHQPPQPLPVRRYGQGQRDLDVDFQHLSGPRLVTEILACCLEGFDRGELWKLEVGQRLAALIRAAMEDGQTALDFHLTCRNPACGRQMDLEFTLEDLAEIESQGQAADLQVGGAPDPIGSKWGEDFRLNLRRPTGHDQLAWQASAAAGHPPAADDIVRRLLLDPPNRVKGQPIPPEILQACEQALEAADPLVNFAFTVTCPYCHVVNDIPVDLQAAALLRLRQTQARLLRVVHTLAGRYHWSESEIIRLPEWRRVRYLAMVEEEREMPR
jgi:hypothetical protein